MMLLDSHARPQRTAPLSDLGGGRPYLDKYFSAEMELLLVFAINPSEKNRKCQESSKFSDRPFSKKVDDLYNQNLNEPFSLSIDNYLPQMNPKNQQSSMLPPTPAPNAGMFRTPVQQNNMLASGLTRMEEVYLSPEEKQIRLRSRGINNA